MSSRVHRYLYVVTSACLLMVGVGRAADAPTEADKDRQIKELQAKVQALESRLEALEKLLAARGEGGVEAGAGAGAAPQPAGGRAAAQPATTGDMAPPAQREKLVTRARQRMRQDTQKFSRQQLQEAEALYQVANNNWRTPEAKQSLEQMVQKFPSVNRTGCAVLYLAQYSQGEERERLLKDAISRYGDCFYGNGVQVGAYARLLLGQHYQEAGKADEAKKLFDEIRTKFPDAIGHRGESLAAKLPKE